jgi:predicted nucleic acid-binding Zn ribbon protein
MNNPGKELADKRKITPHICSVCGTIFPGIATAKTFSNRCRQALKRDKLKSLIMVK